MWVYGPLFQYIAHFALYTFNVLFNRSIGTNVDYILICASLGGGTGSGAALRVMELARKYMESLGRPAKVGCVVALPMLGEGQRLARNSLATFKRLRAFNPSPMIIIDNQRIRRISLNRGRVRQLGSGGTGKQDEDQNTLHLFHNDSRKTM